MTATPLPPTTTTTLAAHLAAWPGVAAAGLVTAEGEVAVAGAVEEPFPWASVTKLLVAMTTLVAAEEGTVALEDAAGPPGSSLAHLLAHASGLPFEGKTPVAAPGRRRIYSNTGTEQAAAFIESRAGTSFVEYLGSAVLGPLGMRHTVVEGSPAHGGSGPLGDLLLLARELLAPAVFSPAAVRLARSVAFPGLAGVVPGFGRYEPCDWGLGPEIRDGKAPHWTGERNSPATFGHFGQSGSFVWVDPVAGVALASVGRAAFGPWSKHAWPAISDAVLEGLAIAPGGQVTR